jgi:hypothetical protein
VGEKVILRSRKPSSALYFAQQPDTSQVKIFDEKWERKITTSRHVLFEKLSWMKTRGIGVRTSLF